LVCPRSAKRSLRQPRAIDRAIRVEDFATEMPHNFLINRFTRPHQLVGDRIGLNEVSAKRHKHFTHYGFARSNSASQSDFQQSSLIGSPITTEPQRKHFGFFRNLFNASIFSKMKNPKWFLCVSVTLW
jgi:hypothetical protein